MCSEETVTLSLFDSQAVAFHRQLEAIRDDPRVIVATIINPKMVGGIAMPLKCVIPCSAIALLYIYSGVMCRSFVSECNIRNTRVL